MSDTVEFVTPARFASERCDICFCMRDKAKAIADIDAHHHRPVTNQLSSNPSPRHLLQSPFGEIALAGEPDIAVLFCVSDAAADRGDQRWPASHVCVQHNLDPFRMAAKTFGIKFVERVLELLPDNRGRILPAIQMLKSFVGVLTRGSSTIGRFIGGFHVGKVVVRFIAVPEIAFARRETRACSPNRRCQARPANGRTPPASVMAFGHFR